MTKLILGPPGTGKTTTLLDLVDGYLGKGVRPESIGFISFTKKSVNEARDRAAARFEYPIDDFNYFRTIHSLAFRQLTLSSSQVMVKKHYKELGELIGARVTGIHRQDQMVYEMPIGDQMVFMESLSRLMCKSLEDTWSDLNSDINLFELQHFQESLVKFKRVNLLFDFTDMLCRYHEEGHKPELEVLFVDEAQDLCALQWRIVNQMIEKSKDTYIAGDDDQAIFRWSGADVNYFMELSNIYERDILSQSYRLPKKIFEVSQSLAIQIEDRNEKKFSPKDEEGSVSYVGGIDDLDLSKGEWLILVRNGYLINDLVEYVRASGYPYQTTYYSIAEDEPLKAALYWEKLRSGGEVLVSEVKVILSYMSRKKTKVASLRMHNDDRINMNGFVYATQMVQGVREDIWHKALDKIPMEDREYYIAVRRRDEFLTKTPRIKISTIHGAKGGEAENVAIFTDMSLRTYRNMTENYDDELRVFYVAVTRSKQNLFIVQPQSPNYFQM